MKIPQKTIGRLVFGLGFLLFTLVLIPYLHAQVAMLDPLTQPKFINPLPNPLDPAFIFNPTANHYDIGIYQFEQNLGLIDPTTNDPLSTTVWGYGDAKDGNFMPESATYPGHTFVAQSNEPITVDWYNFLYDPITDKPLPPLLPVDTSIHWAGMQGQVYTGDTLQPDYTLDLANDGVPVVTHLHGGHNFSNSDGLPDAWFTPNIDGAAPEFNGRLYNPNYFYPNDQPAGNLWYHDHALGITRLNVYAGLAGFYMLRDNFDTGLPDNPANLPAFPYEVPIAIQDRMFTADGQLYYPSMPEVPGAPDPSVLPEFFGDTILVNGQAWPVLEVEPRKYRFHLLNGSDSRFYNLSLPNGLDFYQIGTDDALLPQPTWVHKLVLGPGERADVIVDFSAKGLLGKTLIMGNDAKSPFPKGATVNPQTVGQIMAFRVNQPLDTTIPDPELPTSFGTFTPLVQTGPTRELLLFEATDNFGRLQPLLGTTALGGLLWEADITENPLLNDTEVWKVYNTTPDAHPIHIHEVAFQIQSRQKFNATQDPTTGALTNISYIGQPKPPETNELGWKDTAIMYPGEVTYVIATFDRAGEFVWHCHILSHEDHEMMRPYEVLAPSPAPPMLASDVNYAAAVFSGSFPVNSNPYKSAYSQDDEETSTPNKIKQK